MLEGSGSQWNRGVMLVKASLIQLLFFVSNRYTQLIKHLHITDVLLVMLPTIFFVPIRCNFKFCK